MRRACTLFAVLILSLGSIQASAAEKGRIRWITSVYVDAKGVGLKYPEGVACNDDLFVVADTGNSRLIRYAHEDDSVTPEPALRAGKTSPIKVQMTSGGDLYFLDGRDRQIMRMSADGKELQQLEPTGVPSKGDIVPKSFAIDAKDSIYVLDIFSRHVIVLAADGTYDRRVPFPEEHGFITDLTVDANGKIILVDSVEAVVYTAAKGEKQFSRLTESLKEFMNFPARLAVDDDGVIYLVDQHGSGLALIGQDGEFMGRQLGMGWNDRSLYYPAQVCISQSGYVFIADRNNSRVQIYRVGKAKAAKAADEEAAGQDAAGEPSE